MKKLLLSVTVFLLCFSFGYWLKHLNKSRISNPVVSTKNLPALESLTKISTHEAHSFYFSDNSKIAASSPLFWEKTEERFLQPLPKSKSKHQVETVRELATRLSILRSIGEFSDYQKEKISFYSKILADKNQHWLVHREALYQMRPFLRFQGEREREKILANVSSKVRSLASRSTRELLLPLGAKP